MIWHIQSECFLALLLGNLRMPYKEVRDLVMSVDDRVTEQMLEQLLKYMPKKEDVSRICILQ